MGPTEHHIQWVPCVKNRSVTLTTHLHPVPTVRVGGAIPLLPSLPSGRVKGQRYFLFTCRTEKNKLNDEKAKSVRTGWTEPIPKFHNMKELPWKQDGSSETQQNGCARTHARAHTHTTYEF
jgi:hypothetical protein